MRDIYRNGTLVEAIRLRFQHRAAAVCHGNEMMDKGLDREGTVTLRLPGMRCL